MKRLSGDQKGKDASAVPAICVVARLSTERSLRF
jgi:hypothetical protein